VLWIYFGLSGAFYSALRRHDPTFHVTCGVADLALIGAINLAVIVGAYFTSRWML
jgi:ABC-type arginine transport system permease subunit